SNLTTCRGHRGFQARTTVTGTLTAPTAEPIQGAGGVIIPPDSYWPEIQRICKEHDILLIADEVITGYGRTGEWFACQSMDIDADIMTTAKGLSSGYQPIGASIYHDRVAEVLATTDLAHGYTYSGHPVACAVALENLRILDEEGIVTRVRDDIAPYLESRWATLADHPLIGEARSRGLLGAIELSPDPARRARFPGEAGKAGVIVREHCLRHGLMMRAVADTMIISPPLIISQAEVDLLVERARRGLDDATHTLRNEGLL
ncbi:MAG: aminotransferase class III-fold pyridoxal phosphate-dependent enzyme, partial [Pseudomonadota bacterium]